MLLIKWRIPRLYSKDKNDYLNGSKDEVNVRNEQKSFGNLRAESERGQRPHMGNQGGHIGETDQNRIEVPVPGQSNCKYCQKQEKVYMNQ